MAPDPVQSRNAGSQKDHHTQTLFELLLEVWMSLSCYIKGLILWQPSGIVREISTLIAMLAIRSRFGQKKQNELDSSYRARATDLEHQADDIIQRLKARDLQKVYNAANVDQKSVWWQHRFPGDRFLPNSEVIHQTALLEVIHKMPKGASLHIRLDSCLLAQALLDTPKGIDCRFINSDMPLVPHNEHENFKKCEIQLSLKSPDKVELGDLFSLTYRPRQMMRLVDFLQRLPPAFAIGANAWLKNKLVFQETAYKRYMQLFLEDLLDENIQYAEIRLKFTTSNQLYHEDGTFPINNEGITAIVIDMVEKFMAEKVCQSPRASNCFLGIRVIYCASRSLQPENVKAALDECFKFKQKWPQWIAGFDLIEEEEANGRPLKDFSPQLLRFRRDCQAKGLNIPFLFHCCDGMLNISERTGGNPMDALLLNSKCIGHGFAPPKRSLTEILGPTPKTSGNAMHEPLANGPRCELYSRKDTLIRYYSPL